LLSKQNVEFKSRNFEDYQITYPQNDQIQFFEKDSEVHLNKENTNRKESEQDKNCAKGCKHPSHNNNHNQLLNAHQHFHHENKHIPPQLHHENHQEHQVQAHQENNQVQAHQENNQELKLEHSQEQQINNVSQVIQEQTPQNNQNIKTQHEIPSNFQHQPIHQTKASSQATLSTNPSKKYNEAYKGKHENKIHDPSIHITSTGHPSNSTISAPNVYKNDDISVKDHNVHISSTIIIGNEYAKLMPFSQK
jgi:hypothetical protein